MEKEQNSADDDWSGLDKEGEKCSKKWVKWSL